MKQFLDFLPLVVFFAFYKLYDIYAATTALIVATAVVLIYSWVRYRKVEKMALITFVLVAVFGGLTIFFHNDEFIKWKVTVIYALFAGALLFSQWVMKKPLIQRMLGKELSLPQQVWSRLNLAWAVFFILCGLANIYIAFWLPQNIWVNFKVFGLTALTLVFTLLSGIYIYRHMPDVYGVVHTHSTYATAWAATGQNIPCGLTMMGDEFGGPVPVGPFRLIGSEAIGEGVVETLKKYPKSQAVLMQNHGPFTIGKDAEAAVKAAAMTEEVAHTMWAARQLGEIIPISDEDIAKLNDRYTNVYGQH